MARIRTVKPELFRHEDLYELEVKTGFPIRVSFIGLFTACDREGRFKWKPRQLKLDVLPYDEIDFSRVLDALNTAGFITKYEYEGQIYGAIPSFIDHQVINNKEKASALPDVAVSTVLTRQSRDDDAKDTPLSKELGEGKGREGKRKGKGKEYVASDDDDDSTFPTFDDFYSGYPVKKSKQEAIRAWKRLSLEDKNLAYSLTEQFINGIADGIDPPHPSTYLNNKRWEDEPAQKKKPFQVVSSSNQDAAEQAKAAIRERMSSHAH